HATTGERPGWELRAHIADGEEAAFAADSVIHDDATSASVFAFVSGFTTHADETIRIVTGSGGGYGDPKERDRAAVEEDIKN
ncbi:hydantoinase B/oxoprolinase family protein, partial [Bradyrhizobium sp. UFLA 03-164]|nr:hydantoinase B/oxoprolinase family protein [Bradyrhizobium uaiense]